MTEKQLELVLLLTSCVGLLLRRDALKQATPLATGLVLADALDTVANAVASELALGSMQ